MTNYHVQKKNALDRHGVEEEHDTGELIHERRALRLAIGILALIVGLGLVLNAVGMLLDRLIE